MWNAVNREAVEVAQRVRPALIFAVKCSFFHPETIRQIRKSVGVPFVNHYPDHPYIGIRWDPREASALRRDLIEVLRQYSIVWMWERSLVERLRRDGVEAKYLPFAVDPEISRPQSVAEGLHCDACHLTHDVAFVATYTRFRCAEVAAIRKHTIAIWGNNWPRKVENAFGPASSAPASLGQRGRRHLCSGGGVAECAQRGKSGRTEHAHVRSSGQRRRHAGPLLGGAG